ASKRNFIVSIQARVVKQETASKSRQARVDKKETGGKQETAIDEKAENTVKECTNWKDKKKDKEQEALLISEDTAFVITGENIGPKPNPVVQRDDVKELRNSKILLHSLGRDDEVVKTYEEIEAPAVNIYMFNHLRRGIEKHCNSRYKTWAAQLITVYFSSPWKTVALLVATAILVTSFLQTYFAIRPLSDDSHEDFVKLLK
ncbi:UPF0481 protein-like protein, partial [Tanacetum coccineum]